MSKKTILASLVIGGHPPRKSNSRRVVKHGDKTRVIKSKEALDYMESFILQVPPALCLGLGSLNDPLGMDVVIYYRSRRSDLSTEMVKDALQAAGVISNDRYIVEEHAYCFVDPTWPRAEIVIYSLSKNRQPPFNLTNN